MALFSSYPASPASGVTPPGTSAADYGLLAKYAGLTGPYAPMTTTPPVTWRPPIHGVLPTTAGAVSTAPPATTTTTTPVTTSGGYVSSIPGIGGTGIPMPMVPGYKYVYPHYRWEDETSDESAGYRLVGNKEDRDVYDYFPYFPGTMGERAYDSGGSALKHILVGVSLIRE